MTSQANTLLRIKAERSDRIGLWIILVPAAVLMPLIVMHAAGALADFAAAIRYPFELDYGEGIVWQQALLIPGARMYDNSVELPFIVFHYPPLYYLLVRAVALFATNFLVAGRCVSASAAVLAAFSVSGLVLIATRRPARSISKIEVAIAVAAGLLTLCLDPVRDWGSLMRVDMAAIALAMIGPLLGAWGNWRFGPTFAALLFCVAAVFTKQTLLPAGVAVFAVAWLRHPRGAIAAATIAGAIGLAAVGLMEAMTSGGFLRHILADNINRFSLHYAVVTVWAERHSLLLIALMPLAAGAVAATAWRGLRSGRAGPRLRQWLVGFREADCATVTRAMLFLHFALSSLMLFTLFKSGGSSNYFLEWLCVGSALIGVWLCDLLRLESRLAAPVAAMLMGALCLGLLSVPVRAIPDEIPPDEAKMWSLVHRIAAVEKPVASDDMVLLMLAGKPVIFEPAIVTELASIGRWDETPLVDMIRSRGFAFMITDGGDMVGASRRTPAVDSAMRRAYPRVEQIGHLLLHLPAT